MNTFIVGTGEELPVLFCSDLPAAFLHIMVLL